MSATRPADEEPQPSGEGRDFDSHDAPERAGSARSRLRKAFGFAAALLVLGVLAAAGARGLPELAADRGPAPITVDGAAAGEVIAWALIVLGIAGLVFTFWPSGVRPKLPDRPKFSLVRFLILVGFIVVVMSVFRIGLLDQEQGSEAEEPVAEQVESESERSWWAIALLIGSLAAALGGLAVVGRRSGRAEDLTGGHRHERTLDEPEVPSPHGWQLDLNWASDPSRAAVIRRYGEMLESLSAAGHTRRPSEAPVEYLDRIAAKTPGTEPARRLTRLFEIAGFSTRRTTDTMRSDAEAAFEEVCRDLEDPPP